MVLNDTSTDEFAQNFFIETKKRVLDLMVLAMKYSIAAHQ